MRKWLSNLKMTKKLLVSPTVAVVFLAVFGIVSYSAFFKQKAVLDDIFNNRFMYFQTAADILIDLKEVQATTMDSVAMLSQMQAESRQAENKQKKRVEQTEDIGTGQNTKYIQQTIEENRTKCKTALDRVEKSLLDLSKSKQLSKEERTILVSVSGKVSEYHTQINDILEVMLKDADSAQTKMAEAAGLFVDVDKEVHQLLVLERKLSKAQYTSAGTTFAVALTISLIVFIVAVILPFGISLIMKSMVLSPIQKTVKAIEEVAKGDLTQHIEVESADEIGQMAKHFNAFVESLHEVISRVAKSSENVSQAAEVLDRSSEQMAQDIDDAANRVGSLATASEEMSSTTASIAQNCVIAAKSSESASDLGRNGATVIQSAISAMNRISNRVTDSASVIKSLGTRSDQIGNIVDLINDVADQTNLLALNAAIEAARAGEHGRGFAVVADEVRKLAERTSSATKEIGDTIKAMQSETKKAVSSMEEGVAEAETGTVEAAKSRQALEDILKQIATVTAEVNQIAVASEEENATTNEIAGSIQQISSVMQQTASKLQGNVDASHQLADLSKQLQEMVERFKL